MHLTLLTLHSLVRWVVLASLLFAIYRAYRGWFFRKPFFSFDDSVRHWTATISHIQLIIGLVLYSISPIIDFFLHNYKAAVQQRQFRFFGMEHSLMMLVAIALLTIGSALAKRKTEDGEKFKTMAIWFTIALLVILVSIPWPFSPLTSRPFLRFF